MPDDILAEVHSRLPARGGNGNGVVDRKPGVLPGEELRRETACRRIAAEQSPVNKQLYHLPPKKLDELSGVFNRQCDGKRPPPRFPLPKQYSESVDSIA
jgi:hypothetical protein